MQSYQAGGAPGNPSIIVPVHGVPDDRAGILADLLPADVSAEIARRFAVLDSRPRTDDGPVHIGVVTDELLWALQPARGDNRAARETEQGEAR